MKLLFCTLLLAGISIGVLAEERVKRQASYTFPGPRSDRAYHQPPSNAATYVEEDDREAYQAPRRQFEAQPVQPQYAPSQQRAPSAPAAPVYEQPRTAAPRQQAPAKRRASSASNRANKYNSAPQQSLNAPEEDEEDTGPDALTLLLQDSQFACDGKNDGYYADDSVNCQVFHYCVGGAKHSWMCPENTVFHQVHLNCVPDAQDICAQSQKFHFVNDYLYKPIDYEGPNKTARYSQRYYPDGYGVGDPIVAPKEQAPRRPTQTVQSYPAQAPRAPPRQAAPAPPPQPAYRAPPQPEQAYSRPQQSRPASRPSRPVESYPVDVAQAYRGVPVEAPQVYRANPQPQSTPPAEAYRPAQPQSAPRPQAAPQQRRPTYRVVSVPQQESPAAHPGYSSDESLYQPQPQPQARRPSPPVQQARPTAGYAPPRQSYRQTSARSAGGYPAYSSNHGSGVQYDEY